MALMRGVRAPERIYSGVLWLVSLVFAAFLIGLGNLVIGDLPLLEEAVVEQPAPTPEEQGLDRQLQDISAAQGPIDDRLDIARLQLEQAQRASRNGTETFRAWIATRSATTDPTQDPQVLARTRDLEQLKANERAIESEIAGLENRRLALEQQAQTVRDQRYQAEMDAIPARERALFWQELRVFALRLLVALPMLAVATWMVMKKRGSDYWPLMRGFVLAAVFVFFVELVPYLPSYGGYIRYGVGIALTLAAGHFLIKHMRAYLARRRAAEAQGEEDRRRQVSHDEAFRKIQAKTCPGCDRPTATTGDAEANFCVHCGLTLFDRCAVCDTRKMAFFRHCMTCGTPANADRAPPTTA